STCLTTADEGKSLATPTKLHVNCSFGRKLEELIVHRLVEYSSFIRKFLSARAHIGEKGQMEEVLTNPVLDRFKPVSELGRFRSQVLLLAVEIVHVSCDPTGYII